MIYDITPYVELLRRLAPRAVRLVSDTRDVRQGDVFVALSGTRFDARAAAKELAGQLSAVVYDDDGTPFEAAVPSIAVPFLKENLGNFASSFYHRPSAFLHVVALTGTNGKTTSSHWCAQLLTQLGCPAGALGTVGSFFKGEPFLKTRLTTPDAVSLESILYQMKEAGAKAVAMEASSIGIEQGRMQGLDVKTAVFTNLTRDHLDYHQTMEAYERAKTELFRLPSVQNAVVNIDDAAGSRIAEVCLQRGLNLIATSTHGAVAPAGAKLLSASDIRATVNGTSFKLHYQTKVLPVGLSILGEFNVANLLGVIGVALALGFEPEAVIAALPALVTPKGRMQQVTEDASPLAIVDYSHTPDAVEKALEALVPVARVRRGRLICVIGAGGDRDKGKRPMMAAIATKLADQTILTSDNPRSENPTAILKDMKAGATKEVDVIVNRREAIKKAIDESAPEDVILIAGKGHEDYQEIAGVKHPFSDEIEARSAMLMKHPPVGTKSDVETLVQHLTDAKLIGANVPFTHVETDSRKITKGGLFVALVGEKFDGHDYLEAARAAGAVAVVVNREMYCPLPQIVVPDTRVALGESAAFWRKTLSAKIIAVAGSNGKTTTTQMIASVLRQAYGTSAVATQGNFNNDIGVPLTLWRLTPETKIAVIEAGMNHPGEMQKLSPMIAPDVVVLTNAQREHLAYIDGTKGSAIENGQLLLSAREGGVAVIPQEDDGRAIWEEMGKGLAIKIFGQKDDCDVSGVLEESGLVFIKSDAGTFAFRPKLTGRHNARNAAAVTAACLACGIALDDIRRGLEAFEPVARRGVRFASAKMTVIDDSYNANPDSIRADIDVMVEETAPCLLVLGDMAETGDAFEDVHRQVGLYAAEKKIAGLVTFGPGMRLAFAAYQEAFPQGAGAAFDEEAAFYAWLDKNATNYRTVLVKASNSMGFDKVVRHLVQRFKLQ